MMPIEDALERADRREREYTIALDDHDKRIANAWRAWRWWRRAQDVAERGIAISLGAALYQPAWTLAALASGILMAALTIPIANAKTRVDEETRRFDALRRSR